MTKMRRRTMLTVGFCGTIFSLLMIAVLAMTLSICSDVFGKIPFGDMLDKVKAYGINAVKITTCG